MFSVNDLKLGESGYIVSIECSKEIKQRLLDLGLIPKTKITPVLMSPSKTTIAYEFRGSTIALRNDDTKLIYIKSHF